MRTFISNTILASLVAALPLISSCASVEGGGFFSSSGDGEVILVQSSGSGESFAAARNDALYSAIQSSLGAIVTREMVLSNDELNERIVSYTEGFVESFEILKQIEDNGFYVELAAVIRREPLLAFFSDEQLAIANVNGAVIAARLSMNAKQQQAAELLFHKILEDFYATCIVVRIAGPIEELGLDGENNARISIPYTVATDPDAVDRWDAKYRPWLEKIALEHSSSWFSYSENTTNPLRSYFGGSATRPKPPSWPEKFVVDKSGSSEVYSFEQSMTSIMKEFESRRGVVKLTLVSSDGQIIHADLAYVVSPITDRRLNGYASGHPYILSTHVEYTRVWNFNIPIQQLEICEQVNVSLKF
jgi:hypothetical protein